MTDAETWAARLASGEPIAERVAIVVAHPDDETLWTGALLPRLADGLLIHVTDGAPEDMEDAQRLGFETRGSYAQARAREIDEALRRLDARVERRRWDFTDKRAAEHLEELRDRLSAELEGADLVISHPYEGGHPDHDAVAWAVAAGCRDLGRSAPARIEFACYHELDNERVFGRFRPGSREHERPLSEDDQRRVAAAIAAHRTQAGVIGGWTPLREAWRAAPDYDFTAPPAGKALYDRFGWEMTSARFCALAQDAEAGPATC